MRREDLSKSCSLFRRFYREEGGGVEGRRKTQGLLKLLFLCGNRSRYMLRRSVLHHVPLLLFLFLLSIYFLPSPSNPFNAKSGQSQRATKLPNFILQCIGKVPSESISSRRDSQIYSISNLHSVAKLCYDSHDPAKNCFLIMSERLRHERKRTET